MTKRMLIDASHAEETRVVVLDGHRLEEFDLEAATRKPLKGNIYLAKVVRVEPSLQAAFIEYGGNRHGFLAFSEIHPDYYQIPVADRQRLLEMQAEEAREAAEAEEDPLPDSPMDRAALAEVDRARDHGDEEAGLTVTPPRDPGAAADFAPIADPGFASSTGDHGEALASPGPVAGQPAPGMPDLAADPPQATPDTAAGREHAAGMADAQSAAGNTEPAPPASASGAPPSANPSAYPVTGEARVAAEGPVDAVSGQGDPAPAATEAGPAPEIPAGAWAGNGDIADHATDDPVASVDVDAPARDAAQRPRRDRDRRYARRRDHAGGNGGEDAAGNGRDEEGAFLRPEQGHAAPNGRDRALRNEDDDGAAHGEDELPDIEAPPPPETIGGDGPEEADHARGQRIPPRFLRHYKIQEVIRRRQIMLVQVVKEERGTKGAALTTYISLAGRFSVLMPNSPRGGGVSRKITSIADRKRLREAIDEVGLPEGMSLIVRTAGAQRPKPEIKRDCEYLLRLWDNIRERTLASSAPALIYEEADLIKRAIRDVFSRDVEEIVVEGEDAYQDARDFMRMLMPQHVKKIQYAREGGLFARHQVEAQLDAMHSPTVQLKSGGYIVINQTEALVAIDVNSGRATRERHIEDTALRTNLEAADEIARQLRLRDLAGLIVIDFIDMESSRHDGMVERRLKEALRHDRARIQVGRISHFGLLEMSRQRLRPSLAETSFVACPHCQGRGTVRSLESSALQVLRAIEEEGARRRAAEICVHVSAAVALYLLNRKRERLTQIEEHFGLSVLFEPDEALSGPAHRIERLRAADPVASRLPERAPQAALRMDFAPEPEEESALAEEDGAEDDLEPDGAAPADLPVADGDPGGDGARRRRRRRRRRSAARPDGVPGVDSAADEAADDGADEGEEDEGDDAPVESPPPPELAVEPGDEGRGRRDGGVPDTEARGPRRRRGRRAPRPEGAAPSAEPHRPGVGPQPAGPGRPIAPTAATPRYLGPTPADPFAGHVDDILAAMEAAEAAAEAAAASRLSRPALHDRAAARDAEPGGTAVDPLPASELGRADPVTEQRDAAVVAEAASSQVLLPGGDAPGAAPTSDDAGKPALSLAALPAAGEGDEAGAVQPSGLAGPATSPSAPEVIAAEAPAPDAEARAGTLVEPKVIGEAPIETPRRGGWWRR
jgi:ribonuclease E